MIEQYNAETRNKWLRETPPSQPGPVPFCPTCGSHGYTYMDLTKPLRDDKGDIILDPEGREIMKFYDVAVRPCECITGGGFGLAKLGVPERFLDCTLSKYQPQNESQKSARNACEDFCRSYPSEKGLLLMGAVGTGKTHLAVSVLAGIRRGLFADTTELLKQMQREIDGTGPKIAMEEARKTELLLLDDLGFERDTKWAQSEIAGLLSYRYNAKLPTIVTTNLRGNTLEERVTPRIASRLHEMCGVFAVTGKDWRRAGGAK